jgi:hypothetical protein
MLQTIRDIIEWLSGPVVTFVAGLVPFLLLGLAALYLLWLVVGYLRVSQVGISAEADVRPVAPLPKVRDGVAEVPRGVPYCPVDGLEYPPGARFCTQCEGDLSVACANCGTSIRAAAESCYRCGTRATMALPALH